MSDHTKVEADLRAEVEHLRAQRDDLQARNTELVAQRREAEKERDERERGGKKGLRVAAGSRYYIGKKQYRDKVHWQFAILRLALKKKDLLPAQVDLFRFLLRKNRGR